MKQKKYFLIIAAAFIGFSSCKKDLNLQPNDTFNESNAFVSLADIQLGTNEAYARYGSYANEMYVSALLSDEAKLGADNAGQGALTYRYQSGSSSGDLSGSWVGNYSSIDQVNRIFKYIPTITVTPAEEPRLAVLQAQLTALRGIAYFHLLQSYSKNYDAADTRGVPIVLEPSPLGQPARNTMSEVMDRIETDLATAKAALPAVTAGTFTDTVMNKINVAAFQARVALYKRDYDAAITFSSEVINSGIKPLVSGSDFSDIWNDFNDYETLFRIRYATSTAIGSLWTTTGSSIYIAPSDKLVASYDASDIRKAAYIGTTGAGNNYVNKFFVSSRGGRVVDMKACRISEMYLIRAEAYAKRATPDLTAGAADLNLLRSNRIFGYTNETFASAATLIDAVLNERFKELAFEGFRFFDLKRNNLPVARLASDAASAWQNLAASSYLFVLPIPSDEMLANSNMVQNDGY